MIQAPEIRKQNKTQHDDAEQQQQQNSCAMTAVEVMYVYFVV